MIKWELLSFIQRYYICHLMNEYLYHFNCFYSMFTDYKSCYADECLKCPYYPFECSNYL